MLIFRGVDETFGRIFRIFVGRKPFTCNFFLVRMGTCPKDCIIFSGYATVTGDTPMLLGFIIRILMLHCYI